jgi:tetratricopeptide (TPR) repeat protein
MKRKYLIIASAIILAFTAMAKDIEQSYNVRRAVEELDRGNLSTASSFIESELSANPKNGDAYIIQMRLAYENKQLGEALTSANNALKYISKGQKDKRGYVYCCVGKIQCALGDTIQGLESMEQAIKLQPNDENILSSRAQILYEMRNYDASDKDYKQIVSSHPESVMGIMGLGRNSNARKDYDSAINQYSRILKLYPDYSSGYSFRAESYIGQGNYAAAMDDICKAIEDDEKAYYLLFQFPTEQIQLVVSKLKGMAAKNPHDAGYFYYIAQLYSDKNMYRQSNEYLLKAYEIDAHPYILQQLAENCSEIGDYASAIAYISQVEEMNSDNDIVIATKADILGDSGDIDGAIAEWSRYIEKNPDEFGGYYRRGFFEDNSNRNDSALEDYDMAITLNPNYAYAYLGKADLLLRLGRDELAMDCYRKVVELDTIPDNSSCAMYAYLALNEKEKGIDYMNRVIAQDPTYAGNYYDAACLYSRLGDLTKSLDNLKIAFEKGFCRFHHVRIDDDLEALRATPEFKQLIQEYESKQMVITDDRYDNGQAQTKQVEIPYTPDGGCAQVKCTINDLPLTFIFDTGASIVSLSMVEANFMLKNGYLKRSDFVGSGRFVDANGDVSEGSIVNLRNVNFGGLELTNVHASVVRNQKAPLLLGQSVLGRLGKIEIDNTNRIIRITQWNPMQD